MKPNKPHLMTTITLAGLALLGPRAWASDADTSATAGPGRNGQGAAAATAHYEGDRGFARTDTRTGQINLARGVAVGVDEDGISLSVSAAVAPQVGPAIATSFNMSIGTDGQVSTGIGTALGTGPGPSTVSVGGGANPAGQAYANSSVVSEGLLPRGAALRREPVIIREPAVRREPLVYRESPKAQIIRADPIRRDAARPDVMPRNVIERASRPAQGHAPTMLYQPAHDRVPGKPTIVREYGFGK